MYHKKGIFLAFKSMEKTKLLEKNQIILDILTLDKWMIIRFFMKLFIFT